MEVRQGGKAAAGRVRQAAQQLDAIEAALGRPEDWRETLDDAARSRVRENLCGAAHGALDGERHHDAFVLASRCVALTGDRASVREVFAALEARARVLDAEARELVEEAPERARALWREALGLLRPNTSLAFELREAKESPRD